MFMTIISFFVIGIIFLIISFFVEGIWVYYVPASLLFLVTWLKIIQAGWEENVETLQMAWTKMDPSAASGYISMIAVIYGIACVIMGNWIALSACVIAFVFSLTMRFMHPY